MGKPSFNLSEFSSLSRVLEHNTQHECALITAFRVARDCGEGPAFTKRENLKRNSNLLAKLRHRGYGVTSVLGGYREGGQDTSERTFFVVNLSEDHRFVKRLTQFGQYFEQDAVMILPVGAVANQVRAYYIRTNDCPDNFMQEDKLFFSKARLGRAVQVFFTRVNGRDFFFDEALTLIREDFRNVSVFSRGLIAHEAKKDWEDTTIVSFAGLRSRQATPTFRLEDGTTDAQTNSQGQEGAARVLDQGFGSPEALYGLTGVSGHRYGVTRHGAYWLWAPLAAGSLNGARSVYIEQADETHETYTVRFLFRRAGKRHLYAVLSEHPHVPIQELKPLFQAETGSYMLFD